MSAPDLRRHQTPYTNQHDEQEQENEPGDSQIEQPAVLLALGLPRRRRGISAGLRIGSLGNPLKSSSKTSNGRSSFRTN